MDINYKTLVPIVGIHAAGKSLLLDILSSMGFQIEEELAELIRKKEQIAVGAKRKDNVLDYRLHRLETKRDAKRIWPDNGIIFIEGWHILNIAYLKTRVPGDELIVKYENYVRRFVKNNTVFCIYLNLNPDLISLRTNKIHRSSEAIRYYSFYQELNKNILKTLKCLRIPYKRISADKPIENVLADAISSLSSHIYGTSYPHKLCTNPPKYLRINITNECNKRCLVCHNEGEVPVKTKRYLAGTEIQKYAIAFKIIDIKKVKIIGGEPTLHPKLKEILRDIAKIGFDDFAIITNGHDLNKWISIFKEVGLKRFNVTIHSLNQTRALEISGSKYLGIVEAIRRAINQGFKIKINTIFIDDRSINDILHLCQTFRGTRITIGVLDPIPPSPINIKPRWMKTLLSNFNILHRLTIKNNYSLPTTRYETEYGVYLDFKTTPISRAKIFRTCTKCIQQGLCKEGIYALRITPNGFLRSCLLRNDNLFNLRSLLSLDIRTIAKILSFWVWGNIR